VDEAGFSKTPPITKTWSPKGETPVIRRIFDREKLNVIASIDCKADGTDADVMFYMQPGSIRILRIYRSSRWSISPEK